jgi:uncharacterized membrane protein
LSDAAAALEAEVPATSTRRAGRLPSVDLLRGLVIALMAVDHTRDFVHAAAMDFPPEDLARTTPAIFLTRWVTHLCAPAFMLCAGLGAGLRLERGGSARDLSRFLWTRGLWLVLLELTLVRLGFFFALDEGPVLLLVFWALGLCMVALALLVRLPYPAVLAVGVGMILLHNALDGVRAARFGAFAWAWQVLHEQGLVLRNPPVIVAYPLVPWIGVMAVGFCLSRLYRLPADERRSLLVRLGLALTAAFVLLRAWNGYGDPRPWAPQERPLFTLLSFLNTTKYPPSLAFLLMTLGPAIALLGWLERFRPGDRNLLLVLGRVPLLFFVLHIPLVHALAMALTWWRYGASPLLLLPPPTLGTPRSEFPADYGWGLATVYLVTAVAVALLYPVCLWFARVKRRHGAGWLSYL